MRLEGSLSQWNSVSLLCLVLSASRTDAKSFSNTVNTNGTVLCAVDAPSLTFDLGSSISSLYSNGSGNSCVPNRIRCAWSCNQQMRCINFNYNENTRQCDLYFYRPSRCALVLSCTNSQVSNWNLAARFICSPTATSRTQLGPSANNYNIASIVASIMRVHHGNF